jgi:hypothetical protein
MKVERNSTIAGQPARAVRDFLLRYNNPSLGFNRECIADRIGADITDELIAAGFIEVAPPPTPEWEREQGIYYQITAAGSRFANHRFLARISRAKAKSLVAEFQTRVAAVNANPETCRVGEVRA